MKCPLCENYFDNTKTKFHKVYAGKNIIRICGNCYIENLKVSPNPNVLKL
jgi:hypothetical protein